MVAVKTLLRRIFPFLGWLPAALRDPVGRRHDLMAGVLSALIMLPQGLVFAHLAGLPPQAGLYTAIFPVIVTALWGSSKHMLSGPNTAMSVVLGLSLAPFALAGSARYVGYAAGVTLAVGLIEYAVGRLRWGRVFDFVPGVVIEGVTVAVALTILLTQVPFVAGLTPVDGYPAIPQAVSTLLTVANWHAAPVELALVTVGVGWAIKRYGRGVVRRTYLAGALVSGTALSLLVGAPLYRVGVAPVRPWPFLVPAHGAQALTVYPLLISAMITLAALGLLQSAVIARAGADRSGHAVDLDQDIRAQGLGNIAAAFLSGFAGGGSFNRSRAHQEAGAVTPVAALVSAAVIALLALVLPRAIAQIPYAVMAGMLWLVAGNLIDRPRLAHLWATRRTAPGDLGLFLVVVAAGVGLGLMWALVIGVAIPVYTYLRDTSAVSVTIDAPPGGPTRVTLTGALFFGSSARVAHRLREVGQSCAYQDVCIIDARAVTYLDAVARRMLRDEHARWESAHILLPKGGGGRLREDANNII